MKNYSDLYSSSSKLYKIHERSCWMRPKCEDLALGFNMEHEIFNSNYKVGICEMSAIPWKVDLAMIDDYRPYYSYLVSIETIFGYGSFCC